MDWIDPTIIGLDLKAAMKEQYGDLDSFAWFTQKLLLKMWKTIFGWRRFFILDWWYLKFDKG